ncbi:hypothetical protein F2P81_025307 [Scophthalmus maximus]|uniref:Uncharacterized protein n=1 Tax=Scophthalmus maximus TaxID=52904 RepID=A0A6A4RKQ2_SCOMX|nr:hypothetical protein F2P81_025307 [Scophthalmus maximus]
MNLGLNVSVTVTQLSPCGGGSAPPATDAIYCRSRAGHAAAFKCCRKRAQIHSPIKRCHQTFLRSSSEHFLSPDDVMLQTIH